MNRKVFLSIITLGAAAIAAGVKAVLPRHKVIASDWGWSDNAATFGTQAEPLDIENLKKLQEWALKNIGGIHGLHIPYRWKTPPEVLRYAKKEGFQIIRDPQSVVIPDSKFSLTPGYL